MAKENLESLCQKAKLAITQNRPDQARQFYLQALNIRADSPDVHYGLATVCFLLNDYQSAIHHFKEVTRIDPLHAGAHINLGAVYNRLDMLEEAIPVLRRGIQLDNHRCEGYYNLGLVYRRKGQPDLAIQAYREATRVNPRMADAHYNLANLYFEKEQYQQAATHYRHALELRPDWEKAQNSLEQAEAAVEAVQEHKHEQRQAADQVIQPVRKLDPSRQVDPQVHGPLLNSMHNATIESENQGRQLLKILLTEIEPAIKELSNCLLHTDHTAGELDQCVEKFEKAIATMRNAQHNLTHGVDRVRALGDHLLKT